MKIPLRQTLLLLVLASTFACNQPKESKEIAEEKNEAKFENKADEKDAQFVVETANSLHALLALSDVAIEKNSNTSSVAAQAVKPEFQILIDEVEAFASSHVISIPVEATDRSTKDVRKLLDEKHSEFDSKWVKEIKERTKDLIGKLESYGEKTNDLNLKTWLNSALPHVRTIQDKFVDLENKISAN